jgi:hypothetical protein
MRKWRSLHSKEGIGDEEGRNYCLAKIRLERGEPPRLVLDLGVVTYGQIARTCEALVNEFALFAFITKTAMVPLKVITILSRCDRQLYCDVCRGVGKHINQQDRRRRFSSSRMTGQLALG